MTPRIHHLTARARAYAGCHDAHTMDPEALEAQHLSELVQEHEEALVTADALLPVPTSSFEMSQLSRSGISYVMEMRSAAGEGRITAVRGVSEEVQELYQESMIGAVFKVVVPEGSDLAPMTFFPPPVPKDGDCFWSGVVLCITGGRDSAAWNNPDVQHGLRSAVYAFANEEGVRDKLFGLYAPFLRNDPTNVQLRVTFEDDQVQSLLTAEIELLSPTGNKKYIS